MKKLLSIILLTAALSSGAFAKTFKLGEDKAYVSVNIPDVWDPEGTEASVSGSYEGAFLSVETSDGDDFEALIDESVKFLTKEGVTIDKKTIKKIEEKINGLSAVITTATGTDKEGPARISLVVVVLPKGKALLITYWGPPAAEDKLAKQLALIFDSIKVIK